MDHFQKRKKPYRLFHIHTTKSLHVLLTYDGKSVSRGQSEEGTSSFHIYKGISNNAELLLGAGHHSKHFRYIISFNPHNPLLSG